MRCLPPLPAPTRTRQSRERRGTSGPSLPPCSRPALRRSPVVERKYRHAQFSARLFRWKTLAAEQVEPDDRSVVIKLLGACPADERGNALHHHEPVILPERGAHVARAHVGAAAARAA